MRETSTPHKATLPPAESAALTKTEALQRAITALGYRARVTEILAYVRDHFGIGEPASAPPLPSPELPAQDEAKRAAPKRGKNKDRADPAE